MKRNLTLSLDEDLLQRARLLCEKRNTTLTKFVRSQLEELVHHDEDYQEAIKRITALMKKRPIRVDRKNWTKDELHER